MTTVTFDTLDLVKKLESSGIPHAQAEAIVRTIADAQDKLVTREYLDLKFHTELAPLKTDLAVLKWMIGLLLASTISLVLKAFF
ncbi:DUF1640 domain-containing protein [Methylomonas paludis]|uniref:DUF1640 domain-containing protein n=1 Tax=Methylomonas paludis TaxID=1173101 RepID=A0A975MN80_9GAMM|nr:DUF1640 domain-containing protein [Methylomonas paludis]QWF70754.1 DUF1640 domain-containing protein [Methylomonas paludis]